MNGKLATDGSVQIDSNTPGTGMYTTTGALRVNTVDTGPGLFADDGAVRGEVSTADGAPASGTGLYTPSGALRMATSGATNNYNNPGIHARDGAYRVTEI